MKTDEELREYYEDFKKNHNNRIPIVKEYRVGMTITNAKDTQKFHPWKWGKNGSWLDYWRAFAGSNSSEFSLAKEPETCSNMSFHSIFDEAKGMNHNNIIVGGHVVVDNDYSVYYIIPICSNCNGEHGKDLSCIYPGTKMVEMLTPEIIEIK